MGGKKQPISTTIKLFNLRYTSLFIVRDEIGEQVNEIFEPEDVPRSYKEFSIFFNHVEELINMLTQSNFLLASGPFEEAGQLCN